MPRTFEGLLNDMKALRAEIRASSKDMDLGLAASWLSKLVQLNEQLCDRLCLMHEELEELESTVDALEKSAKAGARKETGEKEEKPGFWESLFGGK